MEKGNVKKKLRNLDFHKENKAKIEKNLFLKACVLPNPPALITVSIRFLLELKSTDVALIIALCHTQHSSTVRRVY